MDVQERWYRDGRLTTDVDPAVPDGLVHWTSVAGALPDDHDGLLALLARTGVGAPTLHRILTDEARGGVRGGRRPTLRKQADAIALSLRYLSYEDPTDAVESQEEWLLVRGAEIVSISLGPELRNMDPHLWNEAPVRSAVDAVHLVLDRLTTGYEDVVVELVEDVDEVEEAVFSEGRTAEELRIYALKREVAEARRAVAPLVEVLEHEHGTDNVVGQWRTHPGATDMLERLHRLTETVETLDDLLSSALDAHVARVSVQQNEDMRRISAGAALIVVPTFLAGVWGMNFRHMPELDWPWGYPMALTIMALSVIVLWVAFRRSGWF